MLKVHLEFTRTLVEDDVTIATATGVEVRVHRATAENREKGEISTDETKAGRTKSQRLK